VQAALAEGPARAALARIPRPQRSMANAVMLWDGAWVRSGVLADERVARPIRDAVDAAVRSAAPACAEAPVTGPVLLLLPDAGETLVLVVGSGAWRWRDLAMAPHPIREARR
jgi:hypothetical protein